MCQSSALYDQNRRENLLFVGVSRDKSYSWVGGVKQHRISSARTLEDVSQQIQAAIAGMTAIVSQDE